MSKNTPTRYINVYAGDDSQAEGFPFEIRASVGPGSIPTVALCPSGEDAAQITAALNAHQGLVDAGKAFIEAWDNDSAAHIEQAYRDMVEALRLAGEGE